MQLSVSKPFAGSFQDLNVLTTDEFYQSLVDARHLDSVTPASDGFRVTASTNLPKIILALFPKAPATVSWDVRFLESDGRLVIDTIPDVPESWREHFSIDRYVTADGTTVTESIHLELDVPKKWKRLIKIVEGRLETYLNARLDALTRVGTARIAG